MWAWGGRPEPSRAPVHLELCQARSSHPFLLTAQGLKVIDLQMSDYLRVLEKAIQFGHPVLLQNVQEYLDPSLNPVLNKSVTRIGQGLTHLWGLAGQCAPAGKRRGAPWLCLPLSCRSIETALGWGLWCSLKYLPVEASGEWLRPLPHPQHP